MQNQKKKLDLVASKRCPLLVVFCIYAGHSNWLFWHCGGTYWLSLHLWLAVHISSNYSVTDTFASMTSFQHQLEPIQSHCRSGQYVLLIRWNIWSQHSAETPAVTVKTCMFVCMWVMEHCYVVLKEMVVCVWFLCDWTNGQLHVAMSFSFMLPLFLSSFILFLLSF
jgi:hypothetical protein